MRPGPAADHSPPSSAAVIEQYSYTSTHPLGHTGPVTGSLYLTFTEELHISGLSGTASHPDTQKIQIIGFILENSLKFGCYYSQHVAASKPFDHA